MKYEHAHAIKHAVSVLDRIYVTKVWPDTVTTRAEVSAAAEGLRAIIDNDTTPCACGHRFVTHCPGPWESGCDLGANEKFVGVIREDTQP